MKNTLFIILLFTLTSRSNNTAEVTIEIHAPSVDDTTKIFVTGNNPQMGNWQPDKVTLNKIGDHLWRKSFRFKTKSQS